MKPRRQIRLDRGTTAQWYRWQMQIGDVVSHSLWEELFRKMECGFIRRIREVAANE